MILSLTNLGQEKANKYISAIDMLEEAGMVLEDQYDKLNMDIDILITLIDYEDSLDTEEESWNMSVMEETILELIESGHIEKDPEVSL